MSNGQRIGRVLVSDIFAEQFGNEHVDEMYLSASPMFAKLFPISVALNRDTRTWEITALSPMFDFIAPNGNLLPIYTVHISKDDDGMDKVSATRQ